VLGARVDPGNGEARLGQVFDDGPAQKAGLSAGDVLIAIDGIRCTASNWELLLGRHRPGDAIRVTGFRRDELFEYEVVLQAPPADTFVLWLEAPCRPPQRRARSQWLCG
jgi:predicted metalloprotease with PDZ domain